MPTARKKTKPRSKAKSPATRMAAYRARMRARGLKPVVLWLPDRNDPKFIAECRREAAVLAKVYAENNELQNFVDAIADWPED